MVEWDDITTLVTLTKLLKTTSMNMNILNTHVYNVPICSQFETHEMAVEGPYW